MSPSGMMTTPYPMPALARSATTSAACVVIWWSVKPSFFTSSPMKTRLG